MVIVTVPAAVINIASPVTSTQKHKRARINKVTDSSNTKKKESSNNSNINKIEFNDKGQPVNVNKEHRSKPRVSPAAAPSGTSGAGHSSIPNPSRPSFSPRRGSFRGRGTFMNRGGL